VDTTQSVTVVCERVSTDRQDIARQAVQRERAAEQNPGREVVVIQDEAMVTVSTRLTATDAGR
jgi:predicted site-specific integrase-resolvase